MRPPILFLTVAFGVGLWAGLDPLVFPGAALWGVALPLIAAAACLAARAPLGAAVGIMGVAGLLWGTAAVREREATCAGAWSREQGAGSSKAATVRLADPAPASGGIAEAEGLGGACGGSVRLRWPEDHAARGGPTWVVAGKWSGSGLVVGRTRALGLVARGRGAPTAALAALGVLVQDPWALQSVGAWLSVAGVGAVVWAGRAFARAPRLARLAAPALVTTLVTAPISAFAFGTVAPIGVLANLIAIPLAGVAVPGLVIALMLSWLASGPAHLIAAGAGLGLALLDLVARGAAGVPGGHVVMVAGWQAALMWAAVAAAAWWLWNSPRRRWLIAARLAFCATIFVATSFRDVVSLDACRCLTVHFLDVGQGDAAALRTPNGRWIVIDGGPRTPERDAGRRVVVPFLRDQGVGRVAVVVATHGDADHLGGLPAVVEAFPSELVLEPGEPLGRPLYLEFLAGVEASGARWHGARAGDRVEVDSVVLEVLSPDSLWLRMPLDVNDHGVVLRVRYGAVRLLFQADAGLPVEGRLAGKVGRVDLLKVGHHGSRTATSDEWLDELAPREAVISVGRNNHYRHPAPAVLERPARHGVTVFRTDRNGTITFSTDGHGEWVRSHHD